ncbi:hypothetical protein ACS47_16205 [Bacillus cereus]|uniref:hypothetical protein n=1 Tax=Bacillus TaxID=1386 RepID=UPI00016B752A|nr:MULTISPECIES: hypothetical protein [Bacillus]EDZ57562.1 hypothetical protein BCH308197_0979 [Bacillus cereus H3081.97]KMP81859.1 hypothetical protein TU63_24405 [Bacillus cereus]KXI83526.1 hypothetical protein ACS54_01215 [Bacillus cereus]KXI86478.1 hypothetical protein ACS47_16205 [Bacillus cereus]MCU5750264.1 hypothetical protein [Bacillus cereus]
MSSFIVFVALLVVISLFLKSKITFRVKIRKIIKKYPNTIRHLKNGTFKRHELIKSLKDKVLGELSDKKLSTDRKNVGKIVEREIIKEIKGWRGRLLVYLGGIGSLICIFLITILFFPEKALKSRELGKEAFENISKENWGKVEVLKLLGQDQDRISGQKQEENKNEEYFNSGIAFMNNGKEQEAIKQLEQISTNSGKFDEAQKYIWTIKRDQFVKQCLDISYKELKKKPEEYEGEKIHLFGKIYNIQEVNGKTIISLSTAHVNGEYIGDEAFILISIETSLDEGDYIDVYGEMKGNYSKNQQFITKYLNGKQYNIYYDQRTFLKQAPVLETRIIVDSKGRIYGR